MLTASVAESSSFYNTREHSTRTRTVFGKGGPILAANFGSPGPIFRDSALDFVLASSISHKP